MNFRFVYTGIRVKDMDESVMFYTKGLGMKVVGRAHVDMTRGEWAQLKSRTSAQLLELNWYGKDSPFYSKYRKGSELDHLCFTVDSLETALKKLEALGGKKIGGPYVTDGWEMVDVADPNGICIELGAKTARKQGKTKKGRDKRLGASKVDSVKAAEVIVP